MPEFDVVGVGLNATDTLLVVPHFPAYAGKVPFQEEILSPGGQVASAMVACARLGLRAKYIGTIGDDERGARADGKPAPARASTSTTCRSARTARTSPPTSSSTAAPASARYCGAGRTACASTRQRSRPSRSPARACCTSTGTIPRRWSTPRASPARAGIPVTVDVDTIYQGFDKVLPHVDYLIASSEFPVQWTNETRSLQGARA